MNDTYAQQAEALGLAPGTDAHGTATLLLRYQDCQQRHEVEECTQCPAHMECALRYSALNAQHEALARARAAMAASAVGTPGT